MVLSVSLSLWFGGGFHSQCFQKDPPKLPVYPMNYLRDPRALLTAAGRERGRISVNYESPLGELPFTACPLLNLKSFNVWS